jgi:hypothetical protein
VAESRSCPTGCWPWTRSASARLCKRAIAGEPLDDRTGDRFRCLPMVEGVYWYSLWRASADNAAANP